MVLNEATIRLGVAMRQTEDELTRNMLQAGAGVINCVGGVNGDVPTEIDDTDVDAVVKGLLNNDAYTITENIIGSDKFSTAPVRDAFLGMCSTELIGTLDQVQGFKHKNDYSYPQSALKSEWGSIGNVRFLLSSIGSVTANSSLLGANVFNIFIAGMEAYACIEQDGYSSQFIYTPPIYSGPLALNAYAGYKFAEVPRITNDAWITQLRSTLV